MIKKSWLCRLLSEFFACQAAPSSGKQGYPHWSSRGGWLFGALIAVFGSALLAVAWKLSSGFKAPGEYQVQQMEESRFAKDDVIGDLGGKPVLIPKHFANFVAYNGDPGWSGKRREGPPPERTFSSKLSSFGFSIRYPDMVGLSTRELEADKNKQSIYGTMWIRVGVSAGEVYPGAGFLDRYWSRMHEHERRFSYQKLPEKTEGLTVWAPAGIDSKTNLPFRQHHDAKDIFIDFDRDGKILTYISCSNVPHKAAPCEQLFSLEPYLQVRVNVIYRRGLLPEWRSIQELVGKVIRGFEANAAAALSSVSSSEK